MRKYLAKSHIYVALLFLPFILMYCLSGAMYLLDIEKMQAIDTKYFKYKENENYNNIDKKAILKNVMQAEIKNNDFKIASKRYMFLESPTKLASLEPNNKESYKVVVNEKSLYLRFLNIHKGKSFLAKITGFLLCFVLIILVFTGLLMLIKNKNKKQMGVALLSGFLLLFIVFNFT